MNNLKLIVGLGNPGKEFLNTRHNVGFRTIDKYLNQNSLALNKNKFNGQFIKTKILNNDVILAKPETYMNLSGDFVVKIKKFFDVALENILIIYDDKDLLCGKFRLRKTGSSGGQNGMKNIINNLSTKDIKRLKIGIGQERISNTANYVLQKFNKEQIKVVDQTITIACDIIDNFIKDSDFVKLSNKFN